MSGQKVVAWQSYIGDLKSGWKSGAPDAALVEGLEKMGCRIEYAYTKAEPDPLLAQMAEVLTKVRPVIKYESMMIPRDSQDFDPQREIDVADLHGAIHVIDAALSAYNERVKG